MSKGKTQKCLILSFVLAVFQAGFGQGQGYHIDSISITESYFNFTSDDVNQNRVSNDSIFISAENSLSIAAIAIGHDDFDPSLIYNPANTGDTANTSVFRFYTPIVSDTNEHYFAEGIEFSWEYRIPSASRNGFRWRDTSIQYNHTIAFMASDYYGDTITRIFTVIVENQDTVSGLSAIKNSRVSICPNPFTDKITIKPNIEYQLFDISGRQVDETNLSALPVGTYILKTEKGKTRVVKN